MSERRIKGTLLFYDPLCGAAPSAEKGVWAITGTPLWLTDYTELGLQERLETKENWIYGVACYKIWVNTWANMRAYFMGSSGYVGIYGTNYVWNSRATGTKMTAHNLGTSKWYSVIQIWAPQYHRILVFDDSDNLVFTYKGHIVPHSPCTFQFYNSNNVSGTMRVQGFSAQEGDDSNFFLSEYDLAFPAKYVIYQDAGGFVKAKNGETGEIDYVNSDAATVIQAAINASANGDKIFFKQGTYGITTGLTINKNIALEGENPIGTTLKATPPTPPLTNLIDIADTATYVFFTNLQIHGDQKATTVIDASKASPSALPIFFQGCNLHGATGKVLNISNRGGVSIINCKFGLSTSKSDYNLYFNGLAEAALRVTVVNTGLAFAKVASIYIDRFKYLNIVNSIIGCDDGAYHIQVENYATAKIVNTWFENWKAYAIYNSGTAAGRVTSHGARYAGQIKGTFGWVAFNGDTIIYDSGTFTKYFDITVSTLLTGNIWFETPPGGGFTITGSYDFWEHRNKRRYSNQQNFGNATIPNGQFQVTVYHGLAGTPDVVLLTGRDDQVADLIVATKFTDRFIVQTRGDAPVTADRVIDWYAEMRP